MGVSEEEAVRERAREGEIARVLNHRGVVHRVVVSQATSLTADDSLCSVCTEEARLLGDGVCVDDFDVSSRGGDAFYKCSCNSSATGCVCACVRTIAAAAGVKCDWDIH